MRTARRHISLLRSGAQRDATTAGGAAPAPPGYGGPELSERTLHRGGRLHAGTVRSGPPWGGDDGSLLRGPGGEGGSRRGLVAALVALVVALALAGAALALALVGASIGAGKQALADIGLPFGGGTVTSVKVLEGPHSRSVPVALRGDQVWPRGTLPVGQRVVVEAVVKRPGWVAWLTGGSERVKRTLVTPTTRLRQASFTLPQGAPLRLSFTAPVAAISYGPVAGALHRHRLPGVTQPTVPHSGAAGSLLVAAVPRSWERAPASAVSWFPPGVASAAVASPAPGSRIAPGAPIALTFSRSVRDALHGALPVLSPATEGSWRREGSRTLVFQPHGYGYGLGAHVRIALPGGVRLLGAARSAVAGSGEWTVPSGSTARLQQLLAELGYLPLRVTGPAARVQAAPQAQEQAAVSPPSGSFGWRYGNVPAALRGFWKPGVFGVVTKGAVMAFEYDHELTADGLAGPAVWRALIAAAIGQRRNTFGYTFVSVSKSAQALSVWHNGRTVLNTPVNTGISSAPTEAGTFPVYEHIRAGTMSGTNPDGSHYEDPGVPYISYFNGGDALHGFERAQYGFPQSLGCVEMPVTTAGKVWPYTPVGTLVHVAE